MDVPEYYEVELSDSIDGWRVVVYYSLRTAYGYKANRQGIQKVAQQIRSIGMLVDDLDGLAHLAPSEIEQLHEAYLARLPRRDLRRKIEPTLGRYHWLTLTIDFGPLALVEHTHILKVITVSLEKGLVFTGLVAQTLLVALHEQGTGRAAQDPLPDAELA